MIQKTTASSKPSWFAQLDPENMPRHVAIIMDGNGRWAKQQGKPRLFGHQKGIEAVKRTIQAALDIKLPYLSLWAFSTANWKRPKSEVMGLMKLMKTTLTKDLNSFHQRNIRLKVIGTHNALSQDLIDAITHAEAVTKDNTALTLLIDFNYDGRLDILQAAKALAEKVKSGELNPEDITEELFANHTLTAGIPDPDLLIRTSGVMRLSNYMMWQCTFTEFVFLEKYWPDFGEEDFIKAIQDFQKCQRNFGQISS